MHGIRRAHLRQAGAMTGEASTAPLTDSERAFAARAVRRKRAFRILSMVNIAVAALLAVVYGYERLHDPSFAVAPRAIIVLLILLAARQNLRQYRYAAILEKLIRRE
jgi:hypothetical protein